MSRDVYTSITIGDIDVPEGRRKTTPDKIATLARSIEKIGLRHPITVREWKDRYILVAGLHRLEAYRKLGKLFIPALIASMTKTDARMWEIAENLHRSDLTVQEKSDQIAEWIKLSVADDKPAQIAHVSKGGRGNASGISKASKELGVERREAQRSIKIASITPEAKEAAREAGIDDSQYKLLKVSAAPPEKQVEAVREIVAQPPPSSVEKEVTALLKLWNQTSVQGRKVFLARIRELIS